MARKNIINGFHLVRAESLAADFVSEAVNIDYLDNVGAIITASGVSDNTGTFGVEVRLQKNEHEYSDWSALTLTPVPTLANADTDFNLNLKQVPFSMFRITFAAAGGTPDGTCDVWIMAKQVGG